MAHIDASTNNLQQKLPGIIGNAVGQTIGDEVAASMESPNPIYSLATLAPPSATDLSHGDLSWMNTENTMSQENVNAVGLTGPTKSGWVSTYDPNDPYQVLLADSGLGPLSDVQQPMIARQQQTASNVFASDSSLDFSLRSFTVGNIGADYLGLLESSQTDGALPYTPNTGNTLASFINTGIPDFAPSGLQGVVTQSSTNWTSALSDNPISLKSQFDLIDQTTYPAYLAAVYQQVLSGAALNPDDVIAAKNILFQGYGYPMGSIQSDRTSSVPISEQLQSDLSGNMTDQFTNALANVNGLSPVAQDERYNFYSNINTVLDANGNPTNARTINLIQDGKTITMNWSSDFANTAQLVGVSPDEALRKTDFSVYASVMAAAFSTDGLNSLTINGTWRPSVSDYQAIDGMTLPPGYKGWWSSAHVSSYALDINNINGSAINGGSYATPSGQASIPETPIVSNFIENLAIQYDSHQIFSPWKMDSNITGPTFTWEAPNVDHTQNEKIHTNHIHFGTDGT